MELTEVTTTYQYDAFGRRIAIHTQTKHKTKRANQHSIKIIQFPVQQQKTQQSQVSYLWDGNRQVQEYTDTHVFTTVYEQNSFEPIARLVWLKADLLKSANDEIIKTEREAWQDAPKLIPNIEVYHYHNDHLGTSNELTDDKGEVVWLADYEAWGNTAKVVYKEVQLHNIVVSAEELQPIRFQGQFVDQETGLHYNRFRYYDPDLGMFISRDPIGLMGGYNVFQYAPNPTGWIDPFGLSGVEMISPFDLNFSQYYVTDPQYSKIYKSMKENGWDLSQPPLNVIEVEGQLISLDNRRLLVAQKLDLEVAIKRVNLGDLNNSGKTFQQELNKKTNSRPPARSDLPKRDVGKSGTPNQPKVVPSKKPMLDKRGNI